MDHEWRPSTAADERAMLAWEAAEIRMVADLLEKDGQVDRAREARVRALEIDPPAGCC